MSSPFLTILTPVYNRGELVKRCFDSLVAQTDRDFQWIAVDDGSTDDTWQTLQTLKEQAPFPVTILRRENGGKHRALNTAHPHIQGQYVLILDSDDTLTPEAVAAVRAAWQKYESLSQVGIVTFLKGRSPEQPDCYAKDQGVPVDIQRYRRTRVYSSDCCEVIRAELFLAHPFPGFPGENFLSEGALWNEVAKTHKCIYVNQVIYLCSYLEGGLTRSGKPLRLRNPLGGMHTANLNMSRRNYFSRRVKNGLLYTCYGCAAGLSLGQMLRRCDAPALALLCYPFGWLLWKRWRRKYVVKLAGRQA